MVEVVVEAARSQLHGTLNNDVKFHGLQTASPQPKGFSPSAQQSSTNFRSGTLGEFVWVL